MLRASKCVDEEQRWQIAHAVTAAERKTSCEIIPALATASGRFDRPEDLVGLWLAVCAAVAVWLLYPKPLHEIGAWGGASIYVGLSLLVGGMLAAFAIGAAAASRIGWLRRLCTPQAQLQQEVASRARELFFDQRVHHTQGASGLLIYVSLFERMAMVYADRAILEAPELGQEFLDQLCEQLTQGLRQGESPAQAMCAVIETAGERLAGPLPRAHDDVNELADALVLID